MEIERKWLIDKDHIPYELSELEHHDIIQAYISFAPTIRIRKLTDLDCNILTIKSSSHDGGLSREEYEISISDEEFASLLKKCEGLVLAKTRYTVEQDGYMLEIDIFHADYEGLAYLEIEFTNEEEAINYPAPAWVIKEVTYDKRYTNASLARKKRTDI